MNSMSLRSTCRYAVSIILAVAPASLFAQWVDYPTPGLPRSADGKPDLHVPGRVLILTERNIQYRQIFTDGRPLPQDPTPTWNGYSIGHWEGDTLVVETTGFRDDLWLDASGKPLTEQAKTIERIRRPNYGNLEVEITIDDPKAYTAPWTVKLNQPLVLDSELMDYYCLENERDLVHMRQQDPIQIPR